MKAPLLIAVGALALAACHKTADMSAADNAAASNDMAMADETPANDAMMANADMAGNGMDNSAMAAVMTAQKFIDTAAASDTYEIAAAKMAETKGTTPAIKSFATKMVKDHTESTAMIKKAAGTMKPDPTLSAKQQADLDALKAANGTAFDTAYLAQQRAAHADALTLMQGYAASGDNADLKAAAGKIAPVVQSHIAILEGMK